MNINNLNYGNFVCWEVDILPLLLTLIWWIVLSFEYIFPVKKENDIIISKRRDNTFRSDTMDLKNGRNTSFVHTALLVLRLSFGRR